MSRIHIPSCIAALLAVLGVRGAAAQAQGGGSTTTGTSSSDWGGGVAVVVSVLILLVAVGAVVKLYDLKRKREEAAWALQAQISDSLLLDRSLVGLPIAVTGAGGWRPSPLVVAITGSVPTPEVRASVMQRVEAELARRHPGARAEDRLLVDPRLVDRMGREHARSVQA